MSSITGATILLTDEQVEDANLIVEDFDPSLLRGCCYEFRVGPICYVYNYEEKKARQLDRQVHLIRPMEIITIVTMEKVSLDRRHFLNLWAKGSMFSVGLAPICTAADPGFVGHLGITITNLSARPVSLKVGTRFVKGAFYRLSRDVKHAYVGQHGDAKLSWPYPDQFHTEPPDFASLDSAAWEFMPPPVKQMIERLRDAEKYVRWVIYIFTTLLLLNCIQFFGGTYLTGEVMPLLERSIAALGSVASVFGLFLAFSLWQKR